MRVEKEQAMLVVWESETPRVGEQLISCEFATP